MRKTTAGGVAKALVLSILISASAFPAGCGGNVPSLRYDSSSGNVVVEVKSSGGLVPVWVDEAPGVVLYGDGRVVRMSKDGRLLVEGHLTGTQVSDLLEKIAATGFFGLKDSYFDRRVMDGVTDQVTVDLKSTRKSVQVYMMEVKPFSDTVKLLMDYPLSGQKTYVPDKGYLFVVERDQPGGNDAEAPPEIAALLPDGATLIRASADRKPLEIPGESFAKIQEYNSKQEYAGIRVTVGGRKLSIYPVYQPNSSEP